MFGFVNEARSEERPGREKDIYVGTRAAIGKRLWTMEERPQTRDYIWNLVGDGLARSISIVFLFYSLRRFEKVLKYFSNSLGEGITHYTISHLCFSYVQASQVYGQARVD